ncbi:MAG: hypothetical protein SNG38_07905 [Rikenellaceae bacterium]
MKKYLFIIGAVAITMASCVKNELSGSLDGEMSVKLQVETTESTATRADADSRYVVEAYYDETFTTPAYVFENGYACKIESTESLMDMIISPSKEYHFLIWADNGVSYNVESLKSVSLESGEQMSEAWQGTLAVENGSDAVYYTTLKRAVGKVNFSETAEFTASVLNVSFENSAAFNVAIGSSMGDDVAFAYSYTFDQTVTGLLNEEPVYVFAPVTYSNVIDFEFTTNVGSCSATNIPVQANYITTISGEYSESSSAENTLVFEKVEEWGGDEVDPDGLITIRSIDELMRYLEMDNINAKMEPGVYQITTAIAEQYAKISDATQSDKSLFMFEGDNSTYDFTDVKFEITTDILSAVGSYSLYTYHLTGSNIYLKNLESEFIGETYPKSGGASVEMDGSDNTIDGFNLTNRGSYPYGYGDLFGKGSSYTIKFYKHCGILIRGTRPTLKNTTLKQFAFGHAIFIQGATDAVIDNCHVESEVNTTDAVLAEVGTAAANIDFMTDWGYTVPAGYTFALCEEGYRCYSTGKVLGTGEDTSTKNISITNSTAHQVRSAFNTHFNAGTQYVENCVATDSEIGFDVGTSADVVNCAANANYGPAIIYSYNSYKNSNIELEILPSEYIHGNEILAYMGGSGHDFTFTESAEITEKQSYHDDLEIMFGGIRTGLRFVNENNDDYSSSQNGHSPSSNTMYNDTFYPVNLYSQSSKNTVTSKGEVTNNGSSNVVTEL